MEELLEYHSVKIPSTRIQYAALHLKDRALAWWRNLKRRAEELGEPMPLSWSDFKRALRAEFQPVSLERVARGRLDAARQTGGLAEFVTELRQLKWEIPGLTDEELRYRFEKGITKGAIADAITARQELSLEEAFQLAITIDANREARQESYNRSRQNGTRRMEVNAMETTQRDYSGVKCYNCGEFGHISRQCPKPPKGGGRGRGRGARGRGGYGRGNGRGQSA